MKNFIRKILKENKREMYLDKIIQVMKNDFPLYKNLKLYGFYDQLSEDEINYVLSGIFGEPVKKRGNLIFNQNENKIYLEKDNGFWKKFEYDENGNMIFVEYHTGFWEKFEYDKNGKKVYQENSNGMWYKTEYLKNESITTNNYGFFERVLYDDNGKVIYFEDSDGYWEEFEYDDKGNIIYSENSDGYIEDYR